MRIDKWLWLVRLFKSRALATEACHAGKVKLNGEKVKAHREVKIGNIYHVKIGQLEKIIQVVEIPKQRLGASLVAEYAKDLTPSSEYERVKANHAQSEYREHGDGRPTKRDRRQIEFLKDHYQEDS